MNVRQNDNRHQVTETKAKCVAALTNIEHSQCNSAVVTVAANQWTYLIRQLNAVYKLLLRLNTK